MIDSIAGRHIAIRRTSSDPLATVTISRLKGNDGLTLDGEEWIELVGLVLAVKASADWLDGH